MAEPVPSSIDPPLGRRQKSFALVVALVLAVTGVVLTPIASSLLPSLPTYMTLYGSSMLITNFILALLLFARGVTEQDGTVVRLGTAYFFVGVVFLPLTAVFPGAIVEFSLFGSPASAVWLWSFWHAGFGLLVIRFALDSRKPAEKPTFVLKESLGVVLVVVTLTVVSTVGLVYLPTLLADGHTLFSGGGQIIPWTLIVIDLCALYLLSRLPRKSPEQLWLTVGMVAACFDVWLTLNGTERFSLGWYISKVGSLFTTLVVLTALFYDLILLYRKVSASNRLLATLANQDGLTGLANRRRFDEVLELEWRRASRLGRPLALLMLDVDWFKKYNDRYGHLGGDDCLRRVARILNEVALRPADLAARYGGEEFAIILPETDSSGAAELGERIRQKLCDTKILHADSPTGCVTVSIGAAGVIPSGDGGSVRLVRSADGALYQAKKAGRNRIWVDRGSLEMIN